MRWRLIIDEAGTACRHMAVDAAIQDARARDDAPPTLRIYGFAPPAVTLGRFQATAEVDLAACAKMGIEVARRPTGGRAVLHDDEVTYSVVASVEDGIPRGVAASYQHVCGGLVAAYRAIGIDARMARGRARGGGPACYLQATRADLSTGSAKLSGSAQVWARDVCLQHGSVILSRDLETAGRVFRLDDPGALRESSTCLAEELAVVPSSEDVIEALIEGFADALDAEFVADSVTERELTFAEGVLATYHVDG